ncbi:hypothetical protein AMS68_005126 [Peltaster fructicola]|uniref:Autophagy-related protein 101 n=1 Tax=Peltaster fructicola TaxID=286661 RepID=A0A6H0XYB4_9PEZI|nr:hypothetical protein AMS68_005126 [Peltaster fructicola]
MEARQAPEYVLELTADRSTAKDVITATLHTIFFHRIFTSLYPSTHEVLDLTLPWKQEFLERKRKKSGWFVAKADEETIWETWHIDISITGARSEPEAARNRSLMAKSLEDAAFKILETVNEERSHIPPITTNESNPFPYQILVNARG